MNNITRKLVVSNYNTDLEWLKMTYDYGFSSENTIIYDRSDIEKDWSHLGKTIISPNVGENIYDIQNILDLLLEVIMWFQKVIFLNLVKNFMKD